MSRYWDTGEVKSRLSGLFKAELGFMKSANLAGEMVTRYWNESHGENYDQRALCVLFKASRALLKQDPNSAESAIYLWCHQKATSQQKRWFFAIRTGPFDVLGAARWFITKATRFAEETGETKFLESLSLDNPETPL
jgi:hypothetical protein